MLEPRPALAEGLRRGGRDGADGRRRHRFRELPPARITQLSGYPGVPWIEAAEKALGTKLPVQASIAMTGPFGTMMKIAPGGYWLVEDTEPSRGPGEALAAVPCAIVDLTAGRTRVSIESADVPRLLQTGIAIDFDPARFPVDGFALTGVHHTPILVHRAGPERYDLYALRTFALTVWDWLTDAAMEAGYDVG